MKKIQLISLMLVSFCISLAAQELFKESYSKNIKKKETNNYSLEVDSFNNIFDTINKLYEQFNPFSGNIKIGFSGNDSKHRRYFDFSSGINIDYGTYPFELDLATKVNAILDGEKFDEKITEVDISYDYHPEILGGEMLEVYTFLAGYSNDYMSIDEKYEIGMGFIINRWLLMTRKGYNIKERINKLPKYIYKNDTLKKCFIKKIEDEKTRGKKPKQKDICTRIIIGDSLIKKDKIKDFNKKRDYVNLSNIMNNSTFRIGLLCGISYQIEKISVADSIKIDILGNKRYEQLTSEAVEKFILTLRPTLELRPLSNITFKAKPYFKLPIFTGTGFRNIVESGPYKDDKFDVYCDIPISLNYNFTKNATLSIEYRLIYDNAPERKIIEFVDGRGYDILSAYNKHHSFEYKFTYTF